VIREIVGAAAGIVFDNTCDYAAVAFVMSPIVFAVWLRRRRRSTQSWPEETTW